MYFLYEFFFHHSKHYRILNKCAKFQVKSSYEGTQYMKVHAEIILNNVSLPLHLAHLREK